MGGLLGCLAMDAACCFGTAACKCCFSLFRLNSSTATRISYAVRCAPVDVPPISMCSQHLLYSHHLHVIYSSPVIISCDIYLPMCSFCF